MPELMSLMMETHNTREKENAAEISKEEVTSFPDTGVTEAITERWVREQVGWMYRDDCFVARIMRLKSV